MQETIAIFIGIGLSATCGFRIFVPLLGLSVANHFGYLTLSPGFSWVGTYPAMIALTIATVLEIAAYYIPWVDNLLDTIATPGAVIAGTLITASLAAETSPLLRWSLALIAGGGAAGVIQSAGVFLRGTSTAATGGVGNPLISTGEMLAAILGTLISIVLPVLAVILTALIIIGIIRRLIRFRCSKIKTPVSL
ncbi:DUF4126 domain-containing protein [bacterium]|nr:DUF4126 domain-containing protein [candidate division CSSED10-310 bacterium]